MIDVNSDDYEMECDFLHRPPKMYPVETRVEPNEERSTTPPNTILTVPSECCSTPVINVDTNTDASFIKRVGLDRDFFRRSRFSSNPQFMGKLSQTISSSSMTPELAHLNDPRQCKSAENIRPLRFGPEEIPYEYINPFTPDGKLLSNKANAQKRLKMLTMNSVRKFDISDGIESDGQSNTDSEIDYPIRPRLSEFNVSRFNEEFVQLKDIGKGDYGCVYKCLNRMNGCLYAIKRTIKPIKSSTQERIVRNEIYAHGVLDHHNIVRNFSCWKEEGFVFIQNEYCNGGSLEEYIQSNLLTEASLRSLLLQMAHALRYLHSKGLAHMDIKPGNILLSIKKINTDGSTDSENGFSDSEKLNEIVFKLGDLGHVTKLDEENDVEEGDCRYLPREILEENFKHLDRADVFALGLTVYEAAGGGPLPKNGDEWQEIRDGILKHLEQYSKEFNDVLKSMVQPAPDQRPSAAELIQMVKPNPPSPARDDDVFGCLHQYRRNNKLLEQKVETTGQYLRVLFKSHKQLQEKLGKEKTGSSGKDKVHGVPKKKAGVSKPRIVGRKTKRSASTIF